MTQEPIHSEVVVTLTVGAAGKPENVAKIVEVLGRAAAGLGLDGLSPQLNIGTMEAYVVDGDDDRECG